VDDKLTTITPDLIDHISQTIYQRTYELHLHTTNVAESYKLNRPQLVSLMARYPPLHKEFQRARDAYLDDIERTIYEGGRTPRRGTSYQPAIFALRAQRAWQERQEIKHTIGYQDGEGEAQADQPRDLPKIAVITGGRPRGTPADGGGSEQ